MSHAAYALWAQLRTHMQQRYRALFDEVRHYPTPIAHCDDQLPKLIEQRTHALEQLRGMGAVPLPAEDFMRAYVARLPAVEDEVEADILARLDKALGVTPLSKGADATQSRRGISQRASGNQRHPNPPAGPLPRASRPPLSRG